MKVLDFNVFEGRNIYSHKKCIRMDLDLEGYSETPSKDICGFNSKLIKLLPEIKKHRCGIDEEGGFVKRLQEGTYLSHICEHIILAIQNIMGIDVSYGKAREIEGELYYVIYQYEYKNTGIETARIAVDIINSLIKGTKFNLKTRLSSLSNILKEEQLGPSTIAICNEARKKGIPVIRIGEKSMFQLGYGKNGKLIEATIGNNTSAVSVDIASDKLLTKEILNSQCIPIARGGKVNNTLDLLLKAESIGYPVVLKPQYGNQGNGVLVNIKNERDLLRAYKALNKTYKDIIIEKYIIGKDYRICIVDEKVVAVSERKSPYIIGDGKNTIKKLINELNKDNRRGEDHEKILTKIKIDEEVIDCIEKHNYTLDAILPKGIKLKLREKANLSTGGIAVDCTDLICKDNIELCIRASKAIGLDICGLDVCCKDISLPIGRDGAIIEINAAPGIRMHHYPYHGKDRNVAEAIVNMMFKNEEKRIPVVSVTGTNGKTTTTRLISYILSLNGYNVGMTTTGGIYINNKRILEGDTTGPKSAKTILLNKEIDAAVLETARGGIIREGLAYDLADVAVITNITEDHLGIDGINTMEELAKVKALVGEAVKPEGYTVINADDKVSLTILERIKSKIIFFSKDKDNEFIKKNIKNGGISVYIDNGELFIEEIDKKISLINIEDIDSTLNGKLLCNVENAMAACAACIGLKIEYNTIREGLTKFHSDELLNPGRFNVFDMGLVTVILDYGHNIEGYKATINGAMLMSHKRIVGIIGAPGDRQDNNIIELGKISGKKFDYIYIKEDIDKRGRDNGEVADLLKKGVIESGFNKNNLKSILDETEALEEALDNSMPGDLIIMFYEKYEPALKIVKDKLKNKEGYINKESMA